MLTSWIHAHFTCLPIPPGNDSAMPSAVIVTVLFAARAAGATDGSEPDATEPAAFDPSRSSATAAAAVTAGSGGRFTPIHSNKIPKPVSDKSPRLFHRSAIHGVGSPPSFAVNPP
jgi:hypothetical protein